MITYYSQILGTQGWYDLANLGPNESTAIREAKFQSQHTGWAIRLVRRVEEEYVVQEFNERKNKP